MLAWLTVLVLLVIEGLALAWWLRKEFYTLFFREWVTLLYCAVLTGDFLIGWLVSVNETPGGSFGLQLLSILGVLLVVLVVLGTLFFRWVVAHDMTDIPRSRK
jgi:hypothetical protein